jgi:FkbM family methyltransferase
LANSYLLNEIKIEENALVIDCGANVGDFFFAFKKASNKPFRYRGFEPNPTDFLCATFNVPLDSFDIRVENIALWNRDCKLDFFVDTEHASSSLIEPKIHTSILNVEAMRLDSIMNETNIFLLKLEAEGAEPEVLEGADRLLHSIRYIVADVGPERGENEEETRESVIKLLTEKGFSILKENQFHRKTILFANNRFL